MVKAVGLKMHIIVVVPPVLDGKGETGSDFIAVFRMLSLSPVYFL